MVSPEDGRRSAFANGRDTGDQSLARIILAPQPRSALLTGWRSIAFVCVNNQRRQQ